MAQTKTTTVVAPSSPITSFDINSYRQKLADLTNNNTNVVQSIASTLYPSTKSSNIVPSSVIKTPSVTAPISTPVPASTITPQFSSGVSYVVKAGDSLSKIASSNKMTLDQLLALNPSYKTNPNLVQVGASINLGGSPSPISSSPAPMSTPTKTTSISNPTPTPTQTPTPTPTMTPEQIASEAGKAGLSVDEYKKILDSQNVVSKEESDRIKAELGIPALETAVFAKPSQSTEQLFNSAYATSGLADIKTKIQAIDDEIAKARADLTDATGAIDENPFLTESSRVGRGKRVLDQAEKKINNLLNNKQSYVDIYNSGITEINNSILRQTNDFKTNNDLNIAQLNYLVAKADKEVSQLKDTKSNISANTLASYLKGIAEGKAPTTIGNSETGFYKYDPTTKKFILVVAPSELTKSQIEKNKADASGVNTFKPSADQKALVGRFANSAEGVALGFTAEDKAKMYTDQNFFYWVLQKANEAGFY